MKFEEQGWISHIGPHANLLFACPVNQSGRPYSATPHHARRRADLQVPPGNQLAYATSPYLLQHAHNPVHWRSWNLATLGEAQSLDRPILLSIGYAACHWCHVMAHESFEDVKTAGLMNDLFVNIKVDREERPDLDQLYMSALHAMGEQGGWPLTMFLTPSADPFWGGTYFPPTPRWGRPSFSEVLKAVADAYRTRRSDVDANAAVLRRAVASLGASVPGPAILSKDLDQVVGRLLAGVDPMHGGMRGAPKFPNPSIFRFLWQDSFRTGQAAGRDAALGLLRAMSMGGIYDHLGGGYARYATDAEWLVPHFEKMLYDNAQLLELLALAQADCPEPLWVARARETVAWLMRDMHVSTPDGYAAFAASEDADSEGEEGRFYVWTRAEIVAVLGADTAAFERTYDVSDAGNWEGRTILRRLTSLEGPEAEQALKLSRERLLAAREIRVRPGRDDKILADWNGLTIAALCRAAFAFDQPAWLGHAAAAFDFIRLQLATPDGRVAHAWRLGRIAAVGLLDDQAAMARAALALFEATGDPARLDQAIAFSQAALTWFGGDEGGLYTTASDADDIPLGPEARPRSAADNATPSANGLIAEVFARLYHLTGDPVWRDRAEAILTAFAGLGPRLGSAPTLLGAVDLLMHGACVVIVGSPDDPAAQTLAATACAAPDPAVCVLRADPATPPGPDHPAFGKVAFGGRPTAYICRNQVCGLPVTAPKALAIALATRRAENLIPGSA